LSRWLTRAIGGGLVALAALLGVASGAAAGQAEDIAPEELHQGDRVRVVLLRGGDLVGIAVALDPGRGELHVRVAEDILRVDAAVVDWIELLDRTDETPLRRIDPDLPEDPEEARRRRARARARGAGLAVVSFFVPGIGQFALGQPGLGMTYLIGTLVVDAAIALTLLLNEDPFTAAILGGIEVAARISSAALAARRAQTMAVWVAPAPQPGGEGPGWVVGVTGRFR